MSICIGIGIYVCLSCMYVCIYIYTYTYTYIRICVCIGMCIFVCTIVSLKFNNNTMATPSGTFRYSFSTYSSVDGMYGLIINTTNLIPL